MANFKAGTRLDTELYRIELMQNIVKLQANLHKIQRNVIKVQAQIEPAPEQTQSIPISSSPNTNGDTTPSAPTTPL